MSLEAAIAELNVNIAGLRTDLQNLPTAGASSTAASTAAAPATPPASGKPRGRPPVEKAPTYTMDEVKAAAFAVRDKFGKEAAADLIKKHGADSMAKLDPKKFGDFIAACTAELEGEAPGEEASDEL